MLDFVDVELSRPTVYFGRERKHKYKNIDTKGSNDDKYNEEILYKIPFTTKTRTRPYIKKFLQLLKEPPVCIGPKR